MSYKPPFTITPKILNLVSSISESVGVIVTSHTQTTPELRKQNRIKTITGTLAIEGNTLTEEQITAVLEGKRVLGTVRELAEVKGAIEAYDQLNSLNPAKLYDLKIAHRLMMGEILTDAGSFRKKPVGIHKDKKVIHIAPQADMVSGLMADLFKWLETSEYHPLITSTVFHYEFEFIHPFIDGNGRMGRLWQTLILSKWHHLFLSLPLESVIKDHQEGYYLALEQSDSRADCSFFIEFMLTAIDETLSKNATANASQNATVKTPDSIMQLIGENKSITRKEMADKIGKDLSTIARAIKKLQTQGLLKRVGSDKSGHWELIDQS